MSTTVTDWAALKAEAEHIMRSSEDVFDAEIIANVGDFIRFASDRLQVANGVTQGYWPTIRVWWSMLQEPNIEVEIHENHYEYYGLYDGRSDIRHYDHKPGEPMPQEFTDLLPKMK